MSQSCFWQKPQGMSKHGRIELELGQLTASPKWIPKKAFSSDEDAAHVWQMNSLLGYHCAMYSNVLIQSGNIYCIGNVF